MRPVLVLPLIACVVVGAVSVPAQQPGPVGADRLTPAAVAESLVVLRTLTTELRSNERNAELWYRRGMLAWALYDRSRRRPPVDGLSWPHLIHAADTSFMRAIRLAPDSTRYFITAARFALASGLRFRPGATNSLLNESLERARASGDTKALTDALLLEASRLFQNFETTVCALAARPDVFVWVPPLEGYADNYQTKGIDYVGEGSYLHAEALIREALDVAPAHPEALRQITGLLGEQRRWNDLAFVARAAVTHDSSSAWGWLALGLAAHRDRNTTEAEPAFDRGIALLDSATRYRLFRIERVLPPKDRDKYIVAHDTLRTLMESVYWRNADPLWSRRDIDARVEFYARIVFAEARWSYPDLGLDGVLSDQGRRYVTSATRPVKPCAARRAAWYVANDTTIPPHAGARWTNAIAGMQVDTIPTQLARFRARGGMVDLAISVAPPVRAMVEAMNIATEARTDFWLLAGGLTEIIRDSTLATPASPQLRAQLVPPGAYVYRFETTIDGSTRAARTTSGVVATGDPRTGFTLEGYGMSDVLFVSEVTGDPRGATRWRDLTITPHAGPVTEGGTIGLVWEAYGLASREGSARYTVSVELSRQAVTRGPVPRDIRATISGARISRRPDRSDFTVERIEPHRAVIVEQLTLSLGATPPGNYLLTVRVTDRITNQVMGRSQALSVVAAPTTRRR